MTEKIIPIRTPFQDSPMYQAAKTVVLTLRKHGWKAFFAGGCARDMALGKAVHDIDIATSALPEEVERTFKKTHAVGVSFGVVTVHQGCFQFETATLREERGYSDGRRPDTVIYTDDERLDVERRDFTVNGMLYDPEENALLDYVGGMEDLHRGVLRAIGDPLRRFSEDFLRILRAVRFQARFGFELDPASADAMKQMAPNLARLSPERIREEVEKILTGPRPAEAFRTMERLGILQVILPEVHAMAGVEQPKIFHPEGDVFTHTMLMLEKMAHPTPQLAWSVLLHDVGKPVTISVKDGIPHFYGHEKTGSLMAKDLLLRLKSSASLAENVETIVAGHMRFASVDKMKKANWRKLMAAPTFPDEMELHRMDCASCHGLLGNYVLMLDRCRELASERKLPAPLINGSDLKKMGFPQGPEIGRVLETIRDLQLNEEISTREEALARAEKMKS